MHPKSFRFTENDHLKLTALKSALGLDSDIEVIRYCLTALTGGSRTASPVIVPDVEKISADPAGKDELKRKTLEKLGGPFQMCQKHGIMFNSCWNLHT